MATTTLRQAEATGESFITSRLWECPEDSPDGWRRYMVVIHQADLYRLDVGQGHSISRARDTVDMVGCAAPGGRPKSLSLSFD